jgi:hypothetical protein
MTAVGLPSCFTATLSKLVKVVMAGSPGLWRVMISYCTKLLKGLSHLSPTGEPSLLQCRGIYPLWPTVKFPLKPVLIQVCFSLWWLPSQWGKHWWYDKLATCIFFFLHTVKEIMSALYLCSFAFIRRDVLWDPSAPHFIFFLPFQPQSLSHSSRLPFDEASWRRFHLESATVNDLGSDATVESSAAHPSLLCVGRIVLQNEAELYSCSPWKTLWCNGLLVGSQCSAFHLGMLVELLFFFF